MPFESHQATETIARIAAGQQGLASRAQLLKAGMPSRTIDGRIRAGWLLPVCSGVYAFGRAVTTEKAVLAAGALGAGDGSVLARRSAASLWGFLRWRGQVEILRPESRRPSRLWLEPPGLVARRLLCVKRSEYLGDSDVTRTEGLVVTSVARTLLDLAKALDERNLQAAFNEADRKDLLKVPELKACAARGSGIPGITTFRRLVELRNPSVHRTRSELEAIFLELCGCNGIPGPEVNAKLLGYEVDCFWPTAGLVVELDGFEFHQGRMSFVNDAARENRLKRAGYNVLRFTHDMVVNHPTDVTELLNIELSQQLPGRSSPL